MSERVEEVRKGEGEKIGQNWGKEIGTAEVKYKK